MGRKTKKEKILAEYRRKLQAIQTPVYKVPEQRVMAPTVNPVNREPIVDYSYVLFDLRRILLLTALAICAQVVLWYVLRK